MRVYFAMFIYVISFIFLLIYKVDIWPFSYFPMYSWTSDQYVPEYRILTRDSEPDNYQKLSENLIYKGYLSNLLHTLQPERSSLDRLRLLKHIYSSKSYKQEHPNGKFLIIQKRLYDMTENQLGEWENVYYWPGVRNESQ